MFEVVSVVSWVFIAGVIGCVLGANAGKILFESNPMAQKIMASIGTIAAASAVYATLVIKGWL